MGATEPLHATLSTARKKRKRLPRGVRRTQIMRAAARLIVEQGYLPVSVEQLARTAGISKGLVYAYFPSQYELLNALLSEELRELSVAGLDTASRVGDLEQAALLCTMLYFERVTRVGRLLHILLADRYMAGHIDHPNTNARNRILVRLSRLARQSLPLSKQETLASIEMIAAIPEEAGSLVFHEELEPSVARNICHTLLVTSLEALRSPESIAIDLGDVSGTVEHHR